MIRTLVAQELSAAVARLQADGRLPNVPLAEVEVAEPKNSEHGDFAANFAMVNAKILGMNPRAAAELLASALEGSTVLTSVEIAGPGFLNLRVDPLLIASQVSFVLSRSKDFAKSAVQSARSQKINVEFVSVNPNGPITIGSGRGAAYGSTLANVLEAAGNTVSREYYINDGVNSEQMRLFAESVRAVVSGEPVPTNGYKGDYVFEAAKAGGWIAYLTFRLAEEEQRVGSLGSKLDEATDLKNMLENDPAVHASDLEYALRLCKSLCSSAAMHKENRAIIWRGLEPMLAVQAVLNGADVARTLLHLEPNQLQLSVQTAMLEAQRTDLEAFGVEFDTWFSEQSLHDSGAVAACIEHLKKNGAADEQPIRRKLKLAKGGKIEDVEIETQASDEEESDSPLPDESRGEGAGGEGQSPTLWLRSTKFGDDMDRVLRRNDGRLTYIASDVAYHKDKLERTQKLQGNGEAKLITILGPDHHGYIGRLQAVLAAQLLDSPPPASREQGERALDEVEQKLYASPEERDACQAALAEAKTKLEVQIFQLVRFLKDGKPAPMRKRDGNIYALIDLVDEIGRHAAPAADKTEQRHIGKDVARFFYLMRSHDTTFDFDLDLAEKQSDENPVFYVQYAYARIASILRKAETAGFSPSTDRLDLLTNEREQTLIKKVCDLPHEVARCAEDYGVHRLTTYAQDLAKTYHYFYDGCRVIQESESDLTRARLSLCRAAQIALRSTLDLLGISAPESM